MNTILPQEILDFWFSDTSKKLWFNSTHNFDQIITTKFETLWMNAKDGALQHWEVKEKSALALIIVLDQFPLNMFRGSPKSFATESDAIRVTYHALANSFDRKLPQYMLPFLYMPLMHSENLKDQELSVQLFQREKLDKNIRFALHHCEIIKKFGRFPHRNAILGRTSTQDELDYLSSDSAFKG